ncbi:MAG: hypothetical protein OXU45_07880 [Candidatus Melainabacteria bacterium]|nr:hypothetical protein [Candidatus Melainabacteria bacterium]
MTELIDLNELPLAINLLIFALAGIGTWFAGSSLSTYGVVIAERIKITQSLMGFIIIAAATSLPELIITLIGSAKGEAHLVLNDMFGGISMQTAIIAVADMITVSAPITFLALQSSLLLEASLLILVLAFTLAMILIKDFLILGWVGLGSILVTLLYLLCLYVLNHYEADKQWSPIEIPSKEIDKLSTTPGHLYAQKRPLGQLVALFSFNVVIVLLCALVLVYTAITIAEMTGLGSSFIGATLLAATTSLPELSVTITAVSMGAYSMAISNIFGSNMIMLALLLPAEVFYTKGAILQEADNSVRYAIISGIILTSIYLGGLILRKKKTFMQMGLDSVLVIILYLMTLVVFYHLR